MSMMSWSTPPLDNSSSLRGMAEGLKRTVTEPVPTPLPGPFEAVPPGAEPPPPQAVKKAPNKAIRTQPSLGKRRVNTVPPKRSNFALTF